MKSMPVILGLTFLMAAAFTPLEGPNLMVGDKDDFLNERFERDLKPLSSLVGNSQFLNRSSLLTGFTDNSLLLTENFTSAMDAEEVELQGKLKASAQEQGESSLEEKEALNEKMRELLQENADLAKGIVELNSEIEILKKEIEAKRDLGLRLKELTEEKMEIEERLKFEQQMAEALSRELSREKKERLAAGEGLDKLKAENVILQEELEGLREEKEILSRHITAMDEAFKEGLAEIDREQEALVKALSQPGWLIEGAVELPPIVVKAAPEEPRRPFFIKYGRILKVDDKRNFVVIDLGKEDGVKPGMYFTVYKGGKRIGKVEVVKTQRRIAACQIMEIAPDTYMEVDDVVVSR